MTLDTAGRMLKIEIVNRVNREPKEANWVNADIRKLRIPNANSFDALDQFSLERQ